jgi:LysM repeat protein
MANIKYGKFVPLAIVYGSLCLLFTLFAQPGWAAPLRQTTPSAADGQEYIVQAGDSLSEISRRFYGQPNAYSAIVEATNAKAESDSRFSPITNPSRIQVGQRLWLPNTADLPLITANADANQPAPTATPATTATATSPTSAPRVRFVTPDAGATVPPTFTVAMTATGLTVEPAGAINENAGHFHILVDTDFVEAGEVIINDAQHLHYGKGQFTTTLNLEPGEHVLRLQFANGAHIALDGPAYQDTITVTVAGDTAEPSVRFVTPINGATVPPTFTVAMTATGLTVEPAGAINENAGHFHILVDTDFVEAGEVIINDAQHLHYGKGQYTTTLNLEPGEHVLRLQFANGAHIALDGPAYQDTITVTVAEAMSAEPTVRFVTPLDGATVPPTFTVAMSATGLLVEPAGEIHAGAGHFHILIDTDFVPAGDVIINDDQHRHYGKGQYTTTLNLEPGVHVLRLQFADGAHIAQEGAAYQDTITVTVSADATAITPSSAATPAVRFVTPLDGATVPAKFAVTMAATGLTVEPAGEIKNGAGHFHILVDTDFVEAGEVIVNDTQHLHYGKGQYTTTLELPPGQHVLRLQFANGAHIALPGPAYRDEITVTVK